MTVRTVMAAGDVAALLDSLDEHEVEACVDGGRLRVDLHLYEPLPGGTVHYGSAVDGLTFPAGALQGRGAVAGRPVRCEAAEWAVRWHTGYPARDVDRHDVPLLCERFGIDLPAEFA